MNNTLLLGSKSPSRQMLLREANISFQLIQQSADEAACDWGLPLKQLVETIALSKMAHVELLHGNEGDYCFVLTADTLSCDLDGKIHGKPVDRADAIAKIKAARNGSTLATAFCLDKKIWHASQWEIDHRIVRVVSSVYHFIVPDNWIARYFEHSVGYRASGAIAVEEYGAQFLKVVDGSYSTIVGLPMFKLREALDELGFF